MLPVKALLKGRPALIVLSGGQDSATCLALAKYEYEMDPIYTVNFAYGQRHQAEIEMAYQLSKISEVKEHFIIPIRALTALRNSGLLDNSIDINSKHPNNKNLPASFVPGRNYIFLGVAAAKAYQLGIKYILTGVCQTDYSGYPDCRDDTISAINKALNLAMDCEFGIVTPLMYETKAETVKIMQRLGTLDWLKFTNTCYNGERPPCGECPACKIRAKGFREADVTDPLFTQTFTGTDQSPQE